MHQPHALCGCQRPPCYDSRPYDCSRAERLDLHGRIPSQCGSRPPAHNKAAKLLPPPAHLVLRDTRGPIRPFTWWACWLVTCRPPRAHISTNPERRFRKGSGCTCLNLRDYTRVRSAVRGARDHLHSLRSAVDASLTPPTHALHPPISCYCNSEWIVHDYWRLGRSRIESGGDADPARRLHSTTPITQRACRTGGSRP